MAAVPDLTNLRPSYVHAMAYEYTTIAGYLRTHPRDSMVLIAIGDHQPPAAVSGRDASWTVPVHVFGRRGPILDRLVERGFRSGSRAASTADRPDARVDGDVPRGVQPRRCRRTGCGQQPPPRSRGAGSHCALTFQPGDIHGKRPGEHGQRDGRHDVADGDGTIGDNAAPSPMN